MKRSLELRQERAKLFEQAQALIPKEKDVRMKAEDSATFDKIMGDVDSLKAEVDRLERAEAMESELRSTLSVAAPGSYEADNGAVDTKTTEQREKRYRKAFGSYLRRGLNGISSEDLNVLRSNGQSAEYRDQDNTVGTSGGYLIPTGFMKELEVALKQYGGMREVARTITTATGNQMPWPTTDDTSIQGVRLGANALTTAASNVDQAFGQVVFNAYTYSSNVFKVPNELLTDSAFDLEAEIRDRIAERIGRIQNYEFTTLTAGSNPTGLVPAASVGVTGLTGTSVSCTYNNLIDLIHSLDPAYRKDAQFMLHDSTLAVVRKIVDLQNRPLFGPGLNGGDPDTIAGYGYVINQDMPVMAADAKSIAFGAYKKYIIRDVANSTVVMRLNELYSLNNETGFVCFTRSDGQLVDAGQKPVKLFVNSTT